MIGLYRGFAAPAIQSQARRAFSKSPKSLKASVDVATKSSTKAASKAPVMESSSFSNVLSFPKDHPFAFQLIIATGKTAAADLMVQMVAEGKKLSEVDWRRNGIFVVFGFAYLGGFQWYLMVNKYRQWFPTMDRFAKMSLAEKIKDTAGTLDAGKMVLFDICVHLPLMYFPTYYTVKEFVGGESWNPVHWVRDGVSKYIKNAPSDLEAMV